jgi:hypothetical protein
MCELVFFLTKGSRCHLRQWVVTCPHTFFWVGGIGGMFFFWILAGRHHPVFSFPVYVFLVFTRSLVGAVRLKGKNPTESENEQT